MRRVFGREMRRLAERLRVLREARGWSLEKAAEAIGMHSKHLQRLETGRGSHEGKPPNITLASLSAVSVAYRITFATLFAEVFAPPPVARRKAVK